ncbi:MAG: gliding motility-associated C-terminal domain-containing protein [Owenweeksia sp.]|nr:gliding motility-associated C-terminal domain-containing protein [Owenweeksia sp.]
MNLYRKGITFVALLLPLWGMACIPTINWGASVSFCQGNSFTLSAQNANATYNWSTGATSPSITISSSGTYWVQVTNPCGSASDTIDVIVDQPISINLGADRSVCSSSPTQLSVPYHATTTYQWSTGATANSISVSQSGSYHVTATNACGTFTDTVQLTSENPPAIGLGSDITRCTPGPVSLSIPTNTTGSILWSDGSQGYTMSVASAGNYWVKAINACGSYADTINVHYLITGQVFSHDSLPLCSGGNIGLSSPAPASSYQWSTGATSQSIMVNQPGSYWLQLGTPCGLVYDTIKVYSTNNAQVNLGPDVTICASQGINLNAGNPGSDFLWSTGSKKQSIQVSSSGIYWVGVDNGCGYVYDTVQVTADPVPVPPISDTIYVCNGNSSAVQDAGQWGNQVLYLWSNGAQTQLGGSFLPGDHWVRVINACDTIIKNFSVKSVVAPSFTLGPDTSVCRKFYRLNPNLGPHAHNFLWSTGSTSHKIRARNTGFYWVTATNVCGSFTDTIHVTLKELPSGITADTITKCAGNGKVLSVSYTSGTSYLWSNGDTNSYTYTSTAGSYWVKAFHECDSIRDTVYLQDVNPLNVNLGTDTVSCRPNKLIFDLKHLHADSLVWSDGSNSAVYDASQSGKHWVTAYNACGAYSDTIDVLIKRRPLRMLTDTAYCSSSMVVLDVGQSRADSYLWNTGDTAASISVSQTGWYYVDITNYCATIRDSAFVRVDYNLPAIDLGPDTLFCGGTLTLDPGNITGAYFLWHNGDTSQTLEVTKTGTYYVNVYNACNSVTDTINVVVTGPPSVSLGNSVKFCRGSQLNLNAQNPGSSYLWSTGDTAKTISISNPGNYWVTISNDCGSLTDSVQVIVEDPLDSLLSLGVDTAICRGDSILLDTKIPGVNTKWQNGTTTNSIYVKQTGDYWVEVSNSCGTWEDTIHVDVIDIPNFSLGPDTVFCAAGGRVELQGPPGLISYQWSTGSTSQNLNVNQPGVYWLTVANDCFSFTDTIEVREEFPLIFDLGADTVLCHGESLVLDPGLTGANVYWSDQTDASALEVTRSGTYWVVAQNACGTWSDTIKVRFDNYLEPAREEVIICRDDTATINLSSLEQDFYWFDGKTDKVRKFYEEDEYPIYISNKCGVFKKVYFVDVSNCDCPFFMANAFTPNGDGLNDVFKVGHSCDLIDFSLKIFNRWGNMVYESEQSQQGWDGTYQGAELPAGVYTYSIHYQWEVYGEQHLRSKTGTITLMR